MEARRVRRVASSPTSRTVFGTPKVSKEARILGVKLAPGRDGGDDYVRSIL